MDKTIKMIAFDLFGVVISDGHIVSHGLMPFLPATVEMVQVKKYYRQYTDGQITEKAFWQGIGYADIPPFRNEFLDWFELDPGLPTALAKFKPDYQLAILSNLSVDWGAYLTQKFGFDTDFSPRIISGEAGCGKPDPAIYQILMKRADLPASAIVFIDDRLENLAAAHALGMTTVHYRREADNHPFRADYVIKRLEDLPDFT